MSSLPSVSIVIPSYNREAVLIQTLNDLLTLKHKAQEILVVDQSPEHTPEVHQALSSMNACGDIHWIKLDKPSIPNAMNIGALTARSDIVLYVDDDILTRSELVLEHAKRYLEPNVNGVAGQVIQSWETELTQKQESYRNNQTDDPDAFLFNSSTAMAVRRFIGCNVSFNRRDLLEMGGFDNNFAKVAYRYEAESAERFVNSGHTLVFEPNASVQHLKEESGGTRSYGDHLTSIKPSHSVGMYYYYLVVKNQHQRWRRFCLSPFRSCITRFHMRHPWYIPITFASHLSGLLWALTLKSNGQRLLSKQQVSESLNRHNPHA